MSMITTFAPVVESIVGITGGYTALLPLGLMILAALILPGIYLVSRNRTACTAFFLVMLVISIIVNLILLLGGFGNGVEDAHAKVYNGLYEYTKFAGIAILLFQMVAFIVGLVSQASNETTRLHYGAYLSLLLVATAGMSSVALAGDLIAIFVGVEATSIPSYVLVAMKRKDPRAAEAAVKYVIIGGLSTALTVYGISMLYGVTGTTNLAELGLLIGDKFTWALAIGLITMIAGYGFKIAAVPFHMWAPDVYEGAATPVSILLATGSKKMGLLVFVKIFLLMFVTATAFQGTEAIQYTFAIIATITMTVGNIVAISQTNIKRMLAYSSVAQAGYILIILAIMTPYALAGGVFHMFTHVVMKGGAFLIVGALICAGVGEKIADYRGLAKRAPFLAFAMMLFLFSLAGIPPLAGFTSKFVLFSAAFYDGAGAVSYQWVWLAFVAVLNSAISLYYYARVVKAMYIEKGASEEPVTVPKAFTVAIVLCVIGVIVLGVYPQIILGPIMDACSAFLTI